MTLEEAQKEVDKWIKTQGICYAAKQKEALNYFLKASCMILTGGPGTGKTLF